LSRCPKYCACRWQVLSSRFWIAVGFALSTGAATSAAICQPARSPRVPAALDTHLYARVLGMADARVFDMPLVDSALAARWMPLRAAATLAIGQVGAANGKPGAPRLRQLLSDSDPAVASNAAYALGLLVDSGSVESLATALRGRAVVAREAAWALGEIGAPARSVLTRALANRVSDEATTIQLLLAAAKLKPVPVAEVRPYLRSTQPSILYAAVYVIGRPRAAAGVRDLIALANDLAFISASIAEARRSAGLMATSPTGRAATAQVYARSPTGRQRARAEIARGLAQSAAGDSLADSSIAVLRRLAADVHPHVRINAIRSLGTYGARAREPLTAAARDADANVRIATAQSLAAVLDSTSGVWQELWQRDTSLMYRSSLMASAVRSGASLPSVTSWIAHRDWQYRSAALAAIGGSSNTQLVSQTGNDHLRDPDPRVRSAAYGLVTGNDTTAPRAAVRDVLLRGLADPDFTVRESVLGTLARHARAADVPVVLDAYVRSQSDTVNDARIAAVGYVAAAWRRDSAAFTPELLGRIRTVVPSDDPLIARAVRGSTPFASWAERKGNVRPIDWYQRLVADYIVPALRGATQRATISTARGDITLELFGADAPITVWNFMNLARTNYYRGTFFHRVVPNFVAQDGDPRGTGSGGPGYAIRDEMNPRRYDRGALGMALSGPDTGGSQYFITHSPQPHLDGHYTVFGRVLRGFAALDALVQGDRILSVTVR